MPNMEHKSIIGLPLEHGWSQVVSNSQQTLTCSLAIAGPQAKNLGRDVTDKLTNASLETAVEFHHLLLDIIRKIRQADHTIQLAALFKPEVKLVLATYQGSIWLKRFSADSEQNFKLGLLLTSQGQLKMLAGKQRPRDQLFLATKDLEQNSDLGSFLNKKNYQTQDLQQFKQSIHALPDCSQCALALITSSPQATDSSKKKDQKVRTPLFKKVASLASTIYTISGQLFQKRKAFNSPKKIVKLTISILVIGGLLTAGGYWYQFSKNQQKEAVSQELEPAQQLINQARLLKTEDILQAREKTTEAIKLLTASLDKYQGQTTPENLVNQVLKEARDLYQDISGQSQVNQLDLFFDLSQVSADFLSTQADANQTALFFLDQGKQSLIKLDFDSKQATLATLPEEIRAKGLATTEDSLFLLGEGIYQVDLSSWTKDRNPSFNQIKTQGDSIREAIFIDSFDGYLYIFNPSSRNIFRFVIQDDQLSEPIGWLTDKKGIEFDQVNSMGINGFIWLSDKNGQLFKLSKGKPVEFSPERLPQDLQSLNSSFKIYTSPGLDKIHLLSFDHNQIVSLAQQGQFLQQIESNSLASATDLVITGKKNQIFAVSGSIIYSVKQ